jgi:hypothetical protein
MARPSVEPSNPDLDSVESLTERVDQRATESRQPDTLIAPPAREDDVAPPVCAACWAY